MNFFPAYLAWRALFWYQKENEKNNAGLQNQASLIKKGTDTSTKGENINNVFLEAVLKVEVSVFSLLSNDLTCAACVLR